jgi:glutamine synthetase
MGEPSIGGREAGADGTSLASSEWLWIVYHDYPGLARGKAVPKHRFDETAVEGVTFAKANWDIGIDDVQVPQPGFGADSGDFRAIPDLSTLHHVPGYPSITQALSWLHDGAGPWEGDPRRRLAGQEAALRAHGLRAMVSFEAEFNLMAAGDSGWQLADSSRMFTVQDLWARWPVFRTALDAIERAGIRVHQFGKEYGPAQFEISLLPREPVAAVDAFLIARQLIKWEASRSGLLVSFMPKPREDRPGNGLHIHFSFWDDQGRQVFQDPANSASLSSVGRAAVAGLLAHASGLAGLGAATPNSYKRLLPGSWAPAHICWGTGNRSALVRVPGPGKARRLEFRSGDSSCNPYLYLAAIMAAAIDGLEAGREPPDSIDEDVGHWSDLETEERGLRRLPSDLSSSLDALAQDDVLMEALGPVITTHYLAVKRHELATFERATERLDALAVSEYELATYLEPL